MLFNLNNVISKSDTKMLLFRSERLIQLDSLQLLPRERRGRIIVMRVMLFMMTLLMVTLGEGRTFTEERTRCLPVFLNRSSVSVRVPTLGVRVKVAAQDELLHEVHLQPTPAEGGPGGEGPGGDGGVETTRSRLPEVQLLSLSSHPPKC